MGSLTVPTVVVRNNRQLIDHVTVDRKSLRDLPSFFALFFRTDGTRQLDVVACNRYVYSTACEGWLVPQGHDNFIGHFGSVGRCRVKSGSRDCVGAGRRTCHRPSTDRQTIIDPGDIRKNLPHVDGTPPISFGCDRPFEDNHSIADGDRDALKGPVSRELLLDFAPEILVTLILVTLLRRAQPLRLVWRRRCVLPPCHGLWRRLLRQKNSLPLPAEWNRE